MGTVGMISAYLWLGLNSTEKNRVSHQLGLWWLHHFLQPCKRSTDVEQIGKGKLNLLTLHKPNLDSFQGGREKEGGKVICLWFLTSFWALPIMVLCLDRVQSRKFDKKTENYERREGINFAVNFAKSLRISQGLPSGEQPVLGSPDNCLQELEVSAVVIAPASPIIITIYYYYCYYYDFNFRKLLWETENRIENAYTYKTFKYFKTFINTNIVKYFSVFTSCSEGAKHC